MFGGAFGSERPRFELSKGLVHVWDSIGSIDPLRYPSFFAMLDDTEQRRAKRFRSERHRNHFVTCRGWLRLLLSAYIGLHPGEIQLSTAEYGKPRLNQNPPNTGLVFNVSHTSERMVFAFGLDCMLGVDIEQIRNLNRLEAIVERICSETENTHWRNLPEDRRLEYFFSIWVRKEAIIKAHGQGISLGLQDCVLDENLKYPVRLPDSCGNVEDWNLIELDYEDDYIGAVAVNRPLRSLERQALPEQQLLNLYLYR